MNYIQTKKTADPSWQTTLFFVILLHALLLGGLYYLNSENPSFIIPTSKEHHTEAAPIDSRT